MNESPLTSAGPPSEPERPSLVEITYYTDPLCCWSWAMEPQWLRLRYEYGHRIRWRYVMGGLLATWEQYEDPLNGIHRPAQMGPLWMQARYVSGMPINDRIWIENPPASSYPACLAFKAAEVQSAAAGEAYLRRLREAVMRDGRNVAVRDVLLDLAEKLAQEAPNMFELEPFVEALRTGTAEDAFREDLMQARYRDVARFPTLTFQAKEGRGVMILGYRPYENLRAALLKVAPNLEPSPQPPPPEIRRVCWGTPTEREERELEAAASL